MNFYCYICGNASGTCLVCESCRTQLTDSQQQQVTELWHDQVCFKAYDPEAERYRCFHCTLFYPRNEVCGDHWPDTKAAAPEKRYDVEAGICCCEMCRKGTLQN